MVVRTLLTIVLFCLAGTLAAMVAYALIASGVVPESTRRSLDGMIGFFDMVLVTGMAMAIAGLTAGMLAARGVAPLISVSVAEAVAIVIAIALAPSFVSRPHYAVAVALGALLAGGLAALCRLLRPAIAGRPA